MSGLSMQKLINSVEMDNPLDEVGGYGWFKGGDHLKRVSAPFLLFSFSISMKRPTQFCEGLDLLMNPWGVLPISKVSSELP
jgi:hypothetical protein